MNGADYLFVLVLGASLVIGILRGFIRESIALLAWLIGIWLAWHFAYLVNPWLGGLLAEPGVREWAGRAIVLFTVVLLGMLVSAIVVHYTHRAAGLATMDRVLGALFGVTRAAVMIGLFVIAGRALQLEQESWWTSARTMPVAETVANWLERYAEPAARDLLEEAARRPGR